MSYRVPNVPPPLFKRPALRFATRAEARAYLNNLYGLWLKATVVAIDKDPAAATHCWVDGKLKPLEHAWPDINITDLDDDKEPA